MSDRPHDLADWLGAEPLPAVTAPLPSGRSEDVAQLVRRVQRAAVAIEKAAPCWAPNKAAIADEGSATWPEFAITRALERNGWSARWLIGWGNQRTPCVGVGQAGALPPEVESILARIDRRAGVDPGGGGWDIVAWRGDERLFIDAKPARPIVRLDGNQARWLGAALDEGFTAADFAIVEYDLGAPPAPTRPARGERATPSRAAAPSTPRARHPRGPAPLPQEIASLLDRARNAAPNERIAYRDQIARAGDPAIRAMELWIATGIHPGFAVRVIEAAGRLDWLPQARASLRRAQATADSSTSADIDAALDRLKTRRKA